MRIIAILLMSVLLTGCLEPIKKFLGKKPKKDPVVVEQVEPQIERSIKPDLRLDRPRKYTVTVPKREAVTSEGLEVNPFITLFSGKSGKIAAYYRVDGHISFTGPKWKKKTFTMKCEVDECVLTNQTIDGYKPSYISFYTVQGCFIKWPGDNYLVSASEMILFENTLLGSCTRKVRKK